MKVKITFIEDVLGTSSANLDVHREFIASKAPDAKSTEEEVEALGTDAVIEKSMTVFPREDGKPFIWDYQIKGFFKDACSMFSRCAGKDDHGKRLQTNESAKITAFKKVIDGLIFVFPRKIPIEMKGEIGNCQRPLRGQTAQGERISLANSEVVPAGSSIVIDVRCLDIKNEKAVREWLDYGVLRGIGQWRNSGKGRFTYKIVQ